MSLPCLEPFGIIVDIQKIIAKYSLPDIVYVVRLRDYDDNTIEGIYLTLEKAVEHALSKFYTAAPHVYNALERHWSISNVDNFKTMCDSYAGPDIKLQECALDQVDLQLNTYFLRYGLFYLHTYQYIVSREWQEYSGFDHLQVYQDWKRCLQEKLKDYVQIDCKIDGHLVNCETKNDLLESANHCVLCRDRVYFQSREELNDQNIIKVEYRAEYTVRFGLVLRRPWLDWSQCVFLVKNYCTDK